MQFGGRRSNNSIGGCQRCLSPFTVRLVHVRVLFRVSLCSFGEMGKSRSPWALRLLSQRRKEALRVEKVRVKNLQNRAKNRELERIRLARSLTQQTTSSTESSEPLNCTVSFDRAAAKHARDLAYTVNELTSGRGLEYQRAVLDKFLEHPLLAHVLPDSVLNRKRLEHCRIVCNGLADAWSGLKYGVGRDRYLARNVIEAAVISVKDDECIQAAARCIGMNRKTLRRALKRRHSLNQGVEGEMWAKNDRRKRKDALQESTIDVVVSWWTEETRVSPSKKDVRRKRVGVKRFISHAGHWLEDSQVRLIPYNLLLFLRVFFCSD